MFIRIGQAARYLGFSRTTLRNWKFVRKLVKLDNVDIDPELYSLLTTKNTEAIAAGFTQSTTFDEMLNGEEPHEIKKFQVIFQKEKTKISLGRSTPEQTKQRDAVGFVNFSYLSILKMRNQFYFVHLLVKKNN